MYAPAHTRSKQERGTERRRKALKVPERARKKRASARKHLDASGVKRPLPQEVGTTLCAARRYPIAGPRPQWVGALAALERDDEPAIPERVQCCRPASGGNQVRGAVQSPEGILHTWRTGTGSPSGLFPRRTRRPFTWSAPHWGSRTCSLTQGRSGPLVGLYVLSGRPERLTPAELADWSHCGG